MNQEKTFEELSAVEIVGALVADDEELKAFKNELLGTIIIMKTALKAD